MLDKQRSKTILKLALPIMAGMSSQSLLNVVDTWMVGNLGAEALAGVGIGGYASFMTVAFVIGLGVGVQALVARRVGEEKWSECAQPLNAGILISILLALPIFSLAWIASPYLVAFLTPEQSVADICNPYYRARIVGIFAIGINFCFRGYWNGISQSMTYMRTLIAMHIFNVILSYGLIFGKFGLPEMGAVGAGIGTTSALFFGTFLYFIQTWYGARKHGFLTQRPELRTLSSVLQTGIPNSFQQLFFSAGLVTLFWIIGTVGTKELAVAHVLITIVLFLILPAIGLAMGATSLVGQALGRKDIEDAYRWGWDVTKLALILLITASLPLWLAPELILAIFLNDTGLIELGRTPLRITGVMICFDAIAIILSNSLLGAGAARTVMKVTLGVQWLLYLPAVYTLGPVLGYGLTAIWVAQAAQRVLTSVIFATLWRQKKWASIKI